MDFDCFSNSARSCQKSPEIVSNLETWSISVGISLYNWSVISVLKTRIFSEKCRKMRFPLLKSDHYLRIGDTCRKEIWVCETSSHDLHKTALRCMITMSALLGYCVAVWWFFQDPQTVLPLRNPSAGARAARGPRPTLCTSWTLPCLASHTWIDR